MLGLKGSWVLSLPRRTFVSLGNVLTDFMLLHLHISPRSRLVVVGWWFEYLCSFWLGHRYGPWEQIVFSVGRLTWKRGPSSRLCLAGKMWIQFGLSSISVGPYLVGRGVGGLWWQESEQTVPLRWMAALCFLGWGWVQNSNQPLAGAEQPSQTDEDLGWSQQQDRTPFLGAEMRSGDKVKYFGDLWGCPSCCSCTVYYFIAHLLLQRGFRLLLQLIQYLVRPISAARLGFVTQGLAYSWQAPFIQDDSVFICLIKTYWLLTVCQGPQWTLQIQRWIRYSPCPQKPCTWESMRMIWEWYLLLL